MPKPNFPDIVIYISDPKGKHNFSESTIALWPAKDGKVDNNGNPYWTGRVSKDPKDSDRWVVAYKFVPKDQRKDADEAPPVDDDPLTPSVQSEGDAGTDGEDVPF